MLWQMATGSLQLDMTAAILVAYPPFSLPGDPEPHLELQGSENIDMTVR